MKYNEKVKDIFKVKNVDLVAHCIAKDGLMGAGIAVMFDRRYPDMKKAIQNHNREGMLDIGEAWLWNIGRHEKPNRPTVANLITKASSYGKPTYEDFEKSIISLRKMIVEYDFKTVAIPMIGAGLDRLNWKKQVLPCLIHNLGDLDIELTVYFTERNSKNMYRIKGAPKEIQYCKNGKIVGRYMITNTNVSKMDADKVEKMDLF